MDRANNMHPFLLLTFTIILMAPVLVMSQVNSTLFISRGCFNDNFEYDVLPDLIQCEGAVHQSCINVCSPTQPYCQSNDMTPELCFQICTSQNARYFGLQDGSQCLCGGAFAAYDSKGQPANSACSKNCTGDQTQKCGGSFRNVVYEITNHSADCFHPGYLNVREDIYPPLNQGDFLVNDTLDYSTICEPPSSLTGTSTITCTENNWSSPPPICTIRCSQPDPLPYVDFELMTAESFAIGETVSYTCVGNTTTYNTECDYRGLWLPTDCPVMCAKTNLPNGGALTTTSHLDYFAMGELVDFVCDGVSLSFTFQCGVSGNWNISSFTCPDAMTTVLTPPATPSNDQSTTVSVIVDMTMTSMEPLGSTVGIGPPRESNQGWVIAVAVIVPLAVILIVIVAICCYRKRKEEQNKHVPQVVLGYIKKKGTLSGTLRHNRDPEKDLTDNPAGDTENLKKGGTLTHSLSSMKQQFVKRVTLNRNRPELPPKKNPKKSSSRSVTSHAEVGYVSPKGARTASEVDMKHPNPPPMKRASNVSIISSVDNGLDEVFKGELRTSRSSEMLDALMMEFDGRVNHGFDNEESSARSSPSLASKNSPTTEHVVVHTARPISPTAEMAVENGMVRNTEQNAETEALETGGKLSNGEKNSNLDSSSSASVGDANVEDESEAADVNGVDLEESPYDSLGEPKPAPAEFLNVNGVAAEIDSPHESAIERNRPAPLTLNSNNTTLPGPESPQYATLADMQSPNGGIGSMGSPGSTSATPTKHDYVNVGRGNSISAVTRMSAEFHHPRPPSLPPDSP